MSKNPQAFPSGDKAAFPTSTFEEGMSLRDYFAGQAIGRVIDAYIVGNGACLGTDHMPSNCAIHAYRIADAMLAHRKQTA